MKFSTISDIHIKNANDCPNHKLFMSFLNSKEVESSDSIFLLGDIFDIFVGNHYEYISEYQQLFTKIKELCEQGKKIYYLEGNHDFHIVKLIEQFSENHNLENLKAFSHALYLRDEDSELTFYLGHGDEIEIENLSYKIYTLFIRSNFMNFVANKVFDYNFIKWLGNRASSASRSRNNNKYQKLPDGKVRNKFRRSVENAFDNKSFDVIICGHSHVRDEYLSGRKFHYYNNGYVPSEKKFIHYNGNTIQFVDL